MRALLRPAAAQAALLAVRHTDADNRRARYACCAACSFRISAFASSPLLPSAAIGCVSTGEVQCKDCGVAICRECNFVRLPQFLAPESSVAETVVCVVSDGRSGLDRQVHAAHSAGTCLSLALCDSDALVASRFARCALNLAPLPPCPARSSATSASTASRTRAWPAGRRCAATRAASSTARRAWRWN